MYRLAVTWVVLSNTVTCVPPPPHPWVVSGVPASSIGQTKAAENSRNVINVNCKLQIDMIWMNPVRSCPISIVLVISAERCATNWTYISNMCSLDLCRLYLTCVKYCQ